MPENDSRETFSAIINQAILHEKTAASLAKKLGVSASILSRWRSGKIFPCVSRFPKISEHLNITIEKLALFSSYFYERKTQCTNITIEKLQTIEIVTDDLVFLKHVFAGTNGKLRLDIAIELLIARKS